MRIDRELRRCARCGAFDEKDADLEHDTALTRIGTSFNPKTGQVTAVCRNCGYWWTESVILADILSAR